MGLDLSLRGAGVVVMQRDGTRLFESTFGEDLTVEATERQKVERLINICSDIVKAAKTWLPDTKDPVVIENHAFNRFTKSSSVTGLAELHGAVKVQLYLVGYTEFVYATESTVRNAVLGKGWSKGVRKGKKQAFKALLEQSGLVFHTDDEMDAWALCEWARKSVVD